MLVTLLILCRSLGIDSEIVSPEECARICPVLRTDDLYGALYNPVDVCAGDPSDICRSMSQGAQLQGMQDLPVTSLYCKSIKWFYSLKGLVNDSWFNFPASYVIIQNTDCMKFLDIFYQRVEQHSLYYRDYKEKLKTN